MINKKGFTLIEILATIVILGLLVTVGYISVRAILDRSNNSYYKTQENMLILAGKDYFADYRSKLPKEIGETAYVTLKKLVDENYIEPIKDKSDKECDINESKVTVEKVTEKEYQYYASLVCDETTTTKGDETPPVIKFTPNNKTLLEEISVTMIVTDNENVSQYRYVITKNGEEYQDSGYKVYNSKVIITLKEEGIYKIIGYAKDESNNLSSRKSGEYIISETVDCSKVSISSNLKEDTWYNKAITVNIKVPENTYRYETSIENSNGEKKLANEHIGSIPSTITLNQEGSYNIKVELFDKHGNSCVSTSNPYKIDKTPPTCQSVTGDSTVWTNQDRYISVKCTDKLGECKNNSYNKTFSEEGKIDTIDIYDKAGNVTSCTVNKYIDKTIPRVVGNNHYTSGDLSYFGWIIIDDISGINTLTSFWEYCYTGHNYDTCGATCSIPNQYSHYPSAIFGDKYKYYYQYAQYPNVDSGSQSYVLGHVSANCIRGHSIRTNFRLCDYANNCLFNENTYFNF